MNIVVSVSDFRNNLVDYLQLLHEGKRIVIKDARKDKLILELTASKPSSFDWDSYIREVKKLAGSNFLAGDEADWKRVRRGFNARLAKSRNY